MRGSSVGNVSARASGCHDPRTAPATGPGTLRSPRITIGPGRSCSAAREPPELHDVVARGEREVGGDDGAHGRRRREDGGEPQPRLVAHQGGAPGVDQQRQRQPRGPQRDPVPRGHGVPAHQPDPVGRLGTRHLVRARLPPRPARRAHQGGQEAAVARADGLGDQGGLVGQRRARLGVVDLLDRQHVGVQRLHRVPQSARADHAVVRGAAVQQVERRQPHRGVLRPPA